MKQIFVRGLSRTGGTLMVTVLDAHPHVAMSYELYEHLLQPTDGRPDPMDVLRNALTAKKSFFFRKSKDDAFEKSHLRTFTARAQRSGIERDTLRRLLEEHRAAGMDFASFAHRMRFVERCALEKMKREGKVHWGSKVDCKYDDLIELYPESYVLYMQRDGRDVAASRKLVGNFKQSIEQIARSWCEQMSRFEQFAAKPGVNARLVNYERLTAEPEAELREVIAFLDLPWDDRLLQFHDEDLTIYKNPMGHLSADQVNKPINASSVGRWKRDLTSEEIAQFEFIAGPTLARLGYEVYQPQLR